MCFNLAVLFTRFSVTHFDTFNKWVDDTFLGILFLPSFIYLFIFEILDEMGKMIMDPGGMELN